MQKHQHHVQLNPKLSPTSSSMGTIVQTEHKHGIEFVSSYFLFRPSYELGVVPGAVARDAFSFPSSLSKKRRVRYVLAMPLGEGERNEGMIPQTRCPNRYQPHERFRFAEGIVHCLARARLPSSSPSGRTLPREGQRTDCRGGERDTGRSLCTSERERERERSKRWRASVNV